MTFDCRWCSGRFTEHADLIRHTARCHHHEFMNILPGGFGNLMHVFASRPLVGMDSIGCVLCACSERDWMHKHMPDEERADVAGGGRS